MSVSSRPPQKIAQAGLILIAASILSHALAFLREVILAAKFGVNSAIDAFLIAMIPVSLFILISDALFTSFLPIFTRERQKQGEEHAWKMASNIMNVFIGSFALIVCVYALCAKPITRLIVPGLSPEGITQAANLIRIMSPILILVLPISLSAAILNSYKQFTYPAFAELMPTVGIITAVALLSCQIGVYSLAIGAVLGYITRFIIQFSRIMGTLKEHYVFSFKIFDPIVKNFTLFVLCTLVANGSYVVSLIVDRYFASFLPAGTIAALGFADKLVSTSFYIFIFAITSAVFPTLSQNTAMKDREEFNALLEKSLRLSLALLLPISAILIILREPLVRLLFERGSFDARATMVTAQCLSFYAIGLFAYGGSFLLTRAWFALHRPKVPAMAGVAAISVHIVFDCLLAGKLGHRGLALANSLAGITNFSILFILLQREFHFCDFPKFRAFLFKAAALSGSVAAVTLLFARAFL